MKHHPTETREVILASAIEAFAERGYSGTSIQDILQATGLSKPTLYYYFKNKADLFRAILDFAYDESFAMMQGAVEKEGPIEKKLCAAALSWFTFTNRHKNLMRLVLATNFAAPKEIPADTIDHLRRKRHFEFLAATIRQAQSNGELSSRYTNDELTHAILGSISHHIRTNLLRSESKLDETLAARLVSIYLQGARS